MLQSGYAMSVIIVELFYTDSLYNDKMKCHRCKKELEKNHPWQECYECISTVYPET